MNACDPSGSGRWPSTSPCGLHGSCVESERLDPQSGLPVGTGQFICVCSSKWWSSRGDFISNPEQSCHINQTLLLIFWLVALVMALLSLMNYFKTLRTYMASQRMAQRRAKGLNVDSPSLSSRNLLQMSGTAGLHPFQRLLKRCSYFFENPTRLGFFFMGWIFIGIVPLALVKVIDAAYYLNDSDKWGPPNPNQQLIGFAPAVTFLYMLGSLAYLQTAHVSGYMWTVSAAAFYSKSEGEKLKKLAWKEIMIFASMDWICYGLCVAATATNGQATLLPGNTLEGHELLVALHFFSKGLATCCVVAADVRIGMKFIRNLRQHTAMQDRMQAAGKVGASAKPVRLRLSERHSDENSDTEMSGMGGRLSDNQQKYTLGEPNSRRASRRSDGSTLTPGVRLLVAPQTSSTLNGPITGSLSIPDRNGEHAASTPELVTPSPPLPPRHTMASQVRTTVTKDSIADIVAQAAAKNAVRRTSRSRSNDNRLPTGGEGHHRSRSVSQQDRGNSGAAQHRRQNSHDTKAALQHHPSSTDQPTGKHHSRSASPLSRLPQDMPASPPPDSMNTTANSMLSSPSDKLPFSTPSHAQADATSGPERTATFNLTQASPRDKGQLIASTPPRSVRGKQGKYGGPAVGTPRTVTETAGATIQSGPVITVHSRATSIVGQQNDAATGASLPGIVSFSGAGGLHVAIPFSQQPSIQTFDGESSNAPLERQTSLDSAMVTEARMALLQKAVSIPVNNSAATTVAANSAAAARSKRRSTYTAAPAFGNGPRAATTAFQAAAHNVRRQTAEPKTSGAAYVTSPSNAGAAATPSRAGTQSKFGRVVEVAAARSQAEIAEENRTQLVVFTQRLSKHNKSNIVIGTVYIVLNGLFAWVPLLRSFVPYLLPVQVLATVLALRTMLGMLNPKADKKETKEALSRAPSHRGIGEVSEDRTSEQVDSAVSHPKDSPAPLSPAAAAQMGARAVANRASKRGTLVINGPILATTAAPAYMEISSTLR